MLGVDYDNSVATTLNQRINAEIFGVTAIGKINVAPLNVTTIVGLDSKPTRKAIETGQTQDYSRRMRRLK